MAAFDCDKQGNLTRAAGAKYVGGTAGQYQIFWMSGDLSVDRVELRLSTFHGGGASDRSGSPDGEEYRRDTTLPESGDIDGSVVMANAQFEAVGYESLCCVYMRVDDKRLKMEVVVLWFSQSFLKMTR